jgi:hypothetical protein
MSQTWTLKKAIDTNCILGRFSDPIPFETLQSSLSMYKQDEIIEEKESLSSDTTNTTTSQRTFQKKQRRRQIKGKSIIRLEEAAKGDPILDFQRVNLEGNLMAQVFAEGQSTKYALLQVVKSNVGANPNEMTSKILSPLI